MADVRVPEPAQQADRLLTERSGGASAVDDDGRAKIRDDLPGQARDVGDWKIESAGDVRGRKGFGGEHVEKDDALLAQRADELIAGDDRHSGSSSHGERRRILSSF